MYFYVFLAPEIFAEASADGEDAVQTLTFVLRAFHQNCFLAVYEDNRWQEAVSDELEKWPPTIERKRVKSLLVQFSKRNRFLYNIMPDYTGVKADLDCVFDQATVILLDLLLVTESEIGRSSPSGVEVATRRSYQDTVFEPRRSKLAVHGKTCSPEEMDKSCFMDFHFAKALKYAKQIDICDRVCGTHNLSDNFRYTVKQFMAWLASSLSDPSNCRIVFHLGQPRGLGADHVLKEIASFKIGPLRSAVVEVRFYDDSSPTPALPHQRFISSDQVALDVDRGIRSLVSRICV